MKKLIPIFIAIITLFTACETQEVKKPKTAIILGVVENPKIDAFTLNRWSRFCANDTLKIVDGKISKEILVKDNCVYKMNTYRFDVRMYIKSGDTIRFKVDMNDIENTLNFYGTSSLKNNLLTLLSKNVLYRGEHYPDAIRMKTYLDSIMNANLSIIDDYVKTTPIEDSNFLHQQKMRFTYANAFSKVRYESLLNYFKKEPINLTDAFYYGIDTLQFEDESMLKYYEYTNYVSETIRNMYRLTNPDYNNKFDKYSFIKKSLKNKKISERLIANSIFLGGNTGAKLDSLMNYIEKEISSERIKQSFRKDYAEIVKLRKGNPAPMWIATNKAGKEYSIADFKGKWVYLDVWASWCKPCVSEIPHMKKMEEKLKDKNIEFVSISIDEKADDWYKALEKHNLHGNQFIMAKDKISSFKNNYMVKGVPAFYLIDPAGKMYTIYPPRTSKVEKFDALMEEIKL